MKFRSSTVVLTTAFLSLIVFNSWAQTYTISTIAGQGLALGDGAPFFNARFGVISAIAVGPDGSFYIADSGYHQVRRIGPDGKLSIFAGGPVRGFAGDGGPATSALLDTPTALVVDSGGAVYIGDSGNHRVRLVSAYGNIQTVAGNGQIAPDPSVSPVLPGEGGPATSAPLNQISGLVFASNSDLVISDLGNNRIFRISNGAIKTVAGNATAPLSLATQPALSATLGGPTGVAADVYGNLYFSEFKTAVVRMIDTKGNLSRLIGTGSPTDQPVASGSPLSYPLVAPIGLTTDASYNMYIIESGRVSMYIPASIAAGTQPTVQAIAGDLTQKVTSGTGDGGSPLSAGMNPRALAVDYRSTIYIADSLPTLDFHNRIRSITSNVIITWAGGNVPTGAGDKGPAVAAELYFPRALALDPKGTVYIADTGDNRVRAITPDGMINTIAGTGAAGTTGNQGPALAANLNHPAGLALDSNGNLYVTDGTLIRQVSSSGVINTLAGGGASTQEGSAATASLLTQTGSLAVDSQNNVYVDQLARVSEVSSGKQSITTLSGTGTSGYSGDNGQAVAAQIGGVAGVTVDASGNLYIADQANGRIRKVDSTGTITTVAGGGISKAEGVIATSALLNNPSAVAVDSTGNLYIAESGANRIRLVGADGNINTIAGNGLQGYAGDGAVATNASLSAPSDLKVDAQGNVYVVDSLNCAIRKLTPLATLPTPAVNGIVNSASLAPGPISPGERVNITGTSLGPNSKVMFDSFAAPVFSSSLTSASVVVPYEISGQTTSQVTVTSNGVTSAPFAVQIAPAAPGIFTLTGDGLGQAVALSQDGSQNGVSGNAPAGTIISILCTGEGLDRPANMTGVPTSSATPSPVLQVSAIVDGEPAEVEQAYSVQGTLGQFVVDVLVPYDASSNSSASVSITVGNATSQNTASISILGAQDQGDPGSDARKMRTRKRTPAPQF